MVFVRMKFQGYTGRQLLNGSRTNLLVSIDGTPPSSTLTAWGFPPLSSSWLLSTPSSYSVCVPYIEPVLQSANGGLFSGSLVPGSPLPVVFNGGARTRS